jgi:hypothetical protein
MVSFGKLSIAAVVAGVVAVSSGSAQSKNQTKVFVITAPSPGSCPVAMQAQHSPGLTAQVPVGRSGSAGVERQHGVRQHLQLALNNSKPTAIESIRITVHGWSAKGRTVPASGADLSDADALQTVDLKVNIGPHETAQTDVWVSGLTAVDSIDLVGVNYSDGSSWKPLAQACRIVPDPEMLISLR